MSYNMDGYVQVVDRIKLFYAKYPEGSLQMGTPTFIDIGEQKWAMGRAYAYRTPTDERPGVGTAWEIVPGTTNFTRGSEIQNLETSAWGRAIGSLGIGIDASIATLDEVQQAKERGKVMRTTETPPDDPWQTEGLSLSPEVVRPKKDSHSTGRTSKGSSMYPATAPQLKAVHAIMGKQGLNDDLDKLAKVNEYLVGLNKEPVGAISEVDKHQCSLLIDHLQAGLTPP
tara:strand:+ start:2583 stop:3263 length:681 start_codon:yes stop_codon:yes gene_type:complete